MVYMVMSVASSETCTTLIRDNYIQKTLQTFEEEEEEIDDKTCTETILKYIDDMCGWIPDSNVQYRRQPNEKTSQKGPGRPAKTDWGSLSRRTGRHENGPQITNYEFKHYSNLRKYIEQYRRFHTCGGPLEKLSQSAYGRTKTIYYTNESNTDAERRTDSRTESRHLLDALRGSVVHSYEEPPTSAPRYHAMTDTALRKRSVSSHNLGNYTNTGWSNVPPSGVIICGEPPPQKPTNSNKDAPMQWTINEHGLTIYQDKSPTVFHQRDGRPVEVSPLPMTGYGPGVHQDSYNNTPFFTPSQNAGIQPKRKQLTTPPNIPTNLPVTSGFSIDRTIGNSRNSSIGATHEQGSLFKDFYSQLVHAAVNLQMTRNTKPSCTIPSGDYHKIQNKINLSPQRQNKTKDIKSRNSSRKSHHSFDTKSTCSSHGSSASSRRGRGKHTLKKDNVKSHHEELSSQQQGQARSHTSSSSATSIRPNPPAHHFVTLQEAPQTAPPYRVSTKNGMDVGVDRRLTVCEATWF